MAKKHFSPLKVFLILFVLFLIFVAVLYRVSPDFQKKADSASKNVQEKIESVVSDVESGVESEKEKIAKKIQNVPSPVPKKLILLPNGLEKPICRGHSAEHDHEIRDFDHYSLCYRESYEQAEWSAYCLEKEELVKNASRSNDFRADSKISTGSASLADYKKSGYDRGHLSPAADFAFDEKAMSETFYMSNMSPQAGSFNRGIWKDLESQVRIWAGIFGRAYVISGPVLEKPAEEYGSIGENHVTVPEFYYKVILAPLYEDENDASSPEDAYGVIAIAFIFPNDKCTGSIFDYAVPIDEVERRTGLDFFSPLDDGTENEIESKVSTRHWR